MKLRMEPDRQSLGVDRDEVEIEESVKISPKEQTVCGGRWTAICKWKDMRGFKRLNNIAMRDGAPLVIGVDKSLTERWLTPANGNASPYPIAIDVANELTLVLQLLA